MGPNGCGKSTLAKHFNGVLVPTSGDVFVDGLNTKEEKNYFEIKKKIGMVFQNPDSQIITSTVEEEIAFGLENLQIPPIEMNSIIKNILSLVELNGMEKTSTYCLSGGQKQRLSIASVLAMKPEMIVLDEPTSMLDPGGRKKVMKIIENLHSTGTTVLLITHSVEESLKSQRVVIMDKGQIVSQGNPKEIFSNVDFIENNKFDIPESTDILYRIKKHGYEVSLKAFESKNCADEIIKLLENNV